jgi:hypothetical protein
MTIISGRRIKFLRCMLSTERLKQGVIAGDVLR